MITVGDLKRIIEENNCPDDMEVQVEESGFYESIRDAWVEEADEVNQNRVLTISI